MIALGSSTAAVRGCPGPIACGTVKGAILQYSYMLARSSADDNTAVNCVSQGIIRTRSHDSMTADQQQHNLVHRIPLDSEGTVDDVAEVVSMFNTNEFMPGESVTFDGGITMQMVRWKW